GPNFESVLAAYGSGAVSRSAETGEVIMNIDVGGGSSNVAICMDGRVVATTAINVGGRLVAFDDNGSIARLEETGRRLGKLVGINLELGQHLQEQEKLDIAETLADALLECIQGKENSTITKMLMMAPAIEIRNQPDYLTFSGGVAEFIYNAENREFNDLGLYLADAIRKKASTLDLPIKKPDHRIRATVIGAGNFSLQVSGSTTFLSSGLQYPLRNLPAVVPYISSRKAPAEEIAKSVEQALSRFDLQEGVDPLILAFNDAVRPSYDNLRQFAIGVVKALPNTIRKQGPILMCFDADIGNSVGNVMKRETGIKNEILSIDEINVAEGDFLDIGAPIIEDVVVPVVIKTLVFDTERISNDVSVSEIVKQ
ncbi:MAG: ethanolamine ammonia-lyase reactivating factor EutA, partial [Promethearchaeota archaeon]